MYGPFRLDGSAVPLQLMTVSLDPDLAFFIGTIFVGLWGYTRAWLNPLTIKAD